MGVLTILLFWRSHIDWPIIDFFGTFGHLPIGAPLCTHMLPYGPPLQFIYMWKLNFGQTIWDNFEVLLGTSWGTFCEFDGNPMGPRNFFLKNPSPPPPSPKREELDVSWMHVEPSYWLHEIFIFAKLFVTIFGLN